MSKLAYRFVLPSSAKIEHTLATAHAPHGGSSVGGKSFKGGEFIPGDHLPDETEARWKRRPHPLRHEPMEAPPAAPAGPPTPEQKTKLKSFFAKMVDDLKELRHLPQIIGEMGDDFLNMLSGH